MANLFLIRTEHCVQIVDRLAVKGKRVLLAVGKVAGTVGLVS